MESTAVDPVCGMSVDTSTELRSTYQGKTYYFCSPACKANFDKDPERYLAKEKSK